MRLPFRHAAKSVRSERQPKPVSSYVLPFLLLKAHHARIEERQRLELWGTGAPRREFLYITNLSDALVYVMKTYSEEETQNVGPGYDVVGLAAQLRLDVSKPDGTPQKLMDSGRLQKMGWKPTTSLEEGVRTLYASFL
jgi:GDP-L-fucose synthase